MDKNIEKIWFCDVGDCASEGNARLRVGEMYVLWTKDKCCSAVAATIDIQGRHLALLQSRGHTLNPSSGTTPALLTFSLF